MNELDKLYAAIDAKERQRLLDEVSDAARYHESRAPHVMTWVIDGYTPAFDAEADAAVDAAMAGTESENA